MNTRLQYSKIFIHINLCMILFLNKKFLIALNILYNCNFWFYSICSNNTYNLYKSDLHVS